MVGTPGWRLVPVLPLVLGLTDGILNALTLASAAILRDAGAALGVSLALRVGTAALVTAGFTVFVADYAERRSVLVRSSRQLNLTQPGRLAATNLGRAVVRESALATVVASLASLVGASTPLLVGGLLPVPALVTIAVTIGFLGALGWVIGSVLAARRTRWAVAMLLGGVVVTVVGTVLDIA
ncbi:hypothetical protein [Cellulomonas sp. HZM]|uniref:hypothetical protein n=1 Tax=Cellulomonas sp. HZM TaxID=1454010 RepID=UPI000A433557|nr:hypothetical protein [Cellulomonas sp. HZM]